MYIVRARRPPLTPQPRGALFTPAAGGERCAPRPNFHSYSPRVDASTSACLSGKRRESGELFQIGRCTSYNCELKDC
ncbi:unnamed protein product, partial [Iphiclides podalirius]